MQFSNEIQRVLLGLLFAFGTIGLSATYWTIAGPTSISIRDDNPRIFEDILRIERGSIYDRDNQLLAQSTIDNGEAIRSYTEPAAYSAIGYYSVRYGEGGTESAFDTMLTGATEITDFEAYFAREVLNVAQVGNDIRLTLDLDIQNTVVDLIADYRGAGVVVDAVSGDLLALVSLPTFDPNTLDDDWDTLTEAEGNPFFNRALQGQYQPGGVMYTLWLAQAILTRYDMTQTRVNAAEAVQLGADTTVTCSTVLDADALSLVQAYLFGCPLPFTNYAFSAVSDGYPELVKTFALDDQITLSDFPVPEPITPTSGTQVSIEIEPELQALQDTLGQGDLTVTPLHIAGIMSAIAHNGNAATPQILDSVRPQTTSDWQSTQTSQPSTPMMTTATVRELRNTMKTNWQMMQPDTYPANVTVGATIATSLSGSEAQSWLIGFVRSEQGQAFAFVVLLEDTRDIEHIVSIGQVLIKSLITEFPSS